MKLSAHADMLERVIANDRTLQMLSKVHARIMADVETEGLYWMDRESITTCEIIPVSYTHLAASRGRLSSPISSSWRASIY